MGEEKPVVASKMPTVLTLEPGEYWWCSCGKSSKQPFVMGRIKEAVLLHKNSKLKTKKKVAFCNCKHSKMVRLCDGAHSTLS